MTTNNFLSSPMFVDLVVLGLVFASGVFSYGRRFSGEFCSLLNWLCALALLYFSFPYWEKILEAFFDSRQFGFLLIVGGFFLFVFASLYIITGMLSRILRNYVSYKLDSGLGLLYGIVRGLVIVCVLFGFLQAFGGTTRLSRQVADSFSAPYVLPLTKRMLEFLDSTAWGEQVL